MVAGDWESQLRQAGCEVRLPPAIDVALDRAEFLRHIAGTDAVMTMLTDRWDAEAFDVAGPSLRIVANYAVGYNNIDVTEATRRRIAVTNTPDVLTAATADLAWALLLSAARRLGESERDLRAGRFHGWGPNDYIGMDLEGRTLAILGPGRIGTAIARRARGWEMPIVYAHPRQKPDFEAATGARRLPLEQLLAEADFIVMAMPLNDATRHLISRDQFALMKPTAVLVNVGRGPTLDEAALVETLRARRIFSAGLDVYELEPKLADGLMDLDNAVLLPHIGSATHAARAGMARLATENILAALRGQRPPQLLNPGWSACSWEANL